MIAIRIRLYLIHVKIIVAVKNLNDKFAEQISYRADYSVCYVIITCAVNKDDFNHTCGKMVNFVLRSCRPISAIFSPSMTIFPSADSISRNNAVINDDLPAPVLPTTPT